MSIDELKDLRSRYEAAIFQLQMRRLEVSEREEREEISQQLAELRQEIQALDEQIRNYKLAQLPKTEESLLGLAPPHNQSGGDTFIFSGTQFDAANFGDRFQGRMAGTQSNRNLTASTPENDRVTPGESSPAQQICNELPAHLLFSVFNSQHNPGERVRVNAELHFFDQTTGQIQLDPIDLPSSDRTIDPTDTEQIYDIAELPNCLSQAVKRSLRHLSELADLQRFSGLCQPVIELFLPTELLWQPLKTWCCEFPKLPERYAIVVRSSDRFQGSRPEDAIHYQTQLASAWKHFFGTERNSFPQIQSSPTLSDLAWLPSSEDCHTKFKSKKYAGIQCFGHWLTPDSDRWVQLIEAGTPFAFWLYDCDIDCEITSDERRAIFQRLIAGDRFTLLETIQDERCESVIPSLRSTSYHLGVFYEDINYSPSQRPPLEWAS
jgi:hypothetical protein